MDRGKVDEYLQQGIYGPKEINPEERKRFLGTLRERIVVALTHAEVRDKKSLGELEKIMRENHKAQLYLNGQIEYPTISKYIKIAGKFGMLFTIVNNQEVETDIGLVIAYDYAIDKEDIFLKKVVEIQEMQKKDNSILKKIKKLF